MNLWQFLKSYWVPLLMALLGIIVGFYMIWPEPIEQDAWERRMQAPNSEEDQS